MRSSACWLAYVSIRLHTSSYVIIRNGARLPAYEKQNEGERLLVRELGVLFGERGVECLQQARRGRVSACLRT